jgi:hypothetical protein
VRTASLPASRPARRPDSSEPRRASERCQPTIRRFEAVIRRRVRGSFKKLLESNQPRPACEGRLSMAKRKSSLALLATEMGLLPRFPAITQTC